MLVYVCRRQWFLMFLFFRLVTLCRNWSFNWDGSCWDCVRWGWVLKMCMEVNFCWINCVVERLFRVKFSIKVLFIEFQVVFFLRTNFIM